MQTFVVECYWPRMMEEETVNTLDQLLPLSREALPAEGVRPLGCILVPSDGMALILFSAPSEAVLRRIGWAAEIPFDRIVASVVVGFGQKPAGDDQSDAPGSLESAL